MLSDDFQKASIPPRPSGKRMKARERLILGRANVEKYALGIVCPRCKHDAVFHVIMPDARSVSFLTPNIDRGSLAWHQVDQANNGRWRCLHPDHLSPAIGIRIIGNECHHNALDGGIIE